jgi:hypothetical protein
VPRWYDGMARGELGVEGPWAAVLTVRDGLIVHAVGSFTNDDAMAAVGP